MLYMIFDISFSILSFFSFFSSIFTFFETVIFGYFCFLAKNTPKLQEWFKKRSKSSICPNIFHISLKKIHFLTLTFFLGPLTWNRPCMREHMCLKVMFVRERFVTLITNQWWNIIKWTQTNIRIYSDATLCTEWIFKYIWMQHIYRTNIQIYS